MRVINYGFRDVFCYALDDDAAINLRLTRLLTECCHVFRAHADGNWKSYYRPKYVAYLAEEIESRPSLIRKLLALKDPVVQNITHAAIQHLDNKN